MNRRHALLSIGTTVTVGLAGCLGSTQTSPNGSTSNTNDETSGSTDTVGGSSTATPGGETATATASVALPDPPFEGMQSEPTETYVVGSQGGTTKTTPTQTPGAHVVQVWNDGEEPREVAVRITGEKTGTQFDETVEIPAGDHLNFVFRTPDAYTVEVSGETFSTTSTVDRNWNECSTSMATLRVTPNGTETKSVSESRTCN
jgi:hypothetical protein